jgi:quinol monooxygenase YgiN
MIGLELAVRSDTAHRIEMRQSLTDLAREAVGGGECLECGVFEDVSVSGRFLWAQWWRSQTQMGEHLRSSAFRTLLGAIKVLGSLETARTLDLQDSTSVMGAFLTDRIHLPDNASEA